jgi:molybdopterin/thiamine biosynthesis adenylyltransferase
LSGEITQWNQVSASNKLGNIQVVFDCLDNIKTREWLSKFCWDKKIPLIHSACSYSIGEIQLIVPGKTEQMREYSEEMKTNEDKRSCKDFDPAICTTNMIVASLQVDKFLDFIINKDMNKPFITYMRRKGISYGGK